MKMDSRVKDVTNQRFGRLVVMKFTYADQYGIAYWLCACDCGREIIIAGNSLRQGRTKSCGCLRRESSSRQTGINGPNYTNGKHCGKYTKAILDLKEECRRQAGYICQECDKTQEQELEDIGMVLCAHHIDLDDSNNVLQNLYCICHVCHAGLHRKIRRLEKELVAVL